MDRAPPPRRGRPPPGPPPSRGRRRGAGRGAPPPAPRPAPPPPLAPPRPPRPKHRRRRGVPGPPPPTVQTKLIIRRLPPTLTAEAFAAAADPLGASAAVWRSFAPGSASASGSIKRTRTVVRHAVAYLGFATNADAVKFNDAFNGFRFEEASPTPSQPAAEYFARVERAMWQGVPPLGKRRNPTPLQGTIESDPDYIEFVKELEAEERREANRNGSLSVAQTSSIFPSKSASASSSQGTSDTGIVGGVLDRTAKGKAGGTSASRNSVITPLMEDVRARRKERDQRKKAPKPPPRAPRAKGRQIVVTDPSRSSGDIAKVLPPPPPPPAARRKKQPQRRSGEFGNGGHKKEEHVVVPKKIPPKPPLNGRRPISVTVRDEGVARISNGSINMNSRIGGSHGGPVQHEANGYNGNVKAIGPRGGAGRARPGRTARGKGKPGPPPLGNAAHSTYVRDGQRSPDEPHASVRLLKKEASNGHKT